MKNQPLHFLHGTVLGLVLIIFSTTLYKLNYSTEGALQYLIYALFLAGLIYTGFVYSKANEGNVTFNNIFTVCFKTTAIVVIIMLIWSLLSPYIFPEMKEKALELIRTKMLKQGQPDEIVEKTISMIKDHYTMSMVMGVVFGYGLFGAIFSVITAAITKRNKNYTGTPS